MQYKYRYLYALALAATLLTVGSLYLLRPAFLLASRLKADAASAIKKGVHQSPLEPAQPASVPRQPLTQSEWLAELVTLSHVSGVMIRSIQFKSPSSTLGEANKLHLVLHGRFQQLYLFLLLLTTSGSNSMILDFSWQPLTKDQLFISMDLLNQTNHPLPNNHVMLPTHSPSVATIFCPEQHGLLLNEEEADPPSSFALQELRMTGYLQTAHRKQALIALPTGAVITVQPGSRLGIENGTVTALANDRTIVTTPENKQVVLRMPDEKPGSVDILSY